VLVVVSNGNAAGQQQPGDEGDDPRMHYNPDAVSQGRAPPEAGREPGRQRRVPSCHAQLTPGSRRERRYVRSATHRGTPRMLCTNEKIREILRDAGFARNVRATVRNWKGQRRHLRNPMGRILTGTLVLGFRASS